MKQVGEPSVEEILESIKKVIARDNRAEVERSAPLAEDDDDDADEPLVLDLAETDSMVPVDDAEELDKDEDAIKGFDSPLLNEDTRSSMRDSLAALAMLSEPGTPPMIVRSGETSLEGLTRELLRPALAEWLDKYLPQMVERLVAAEIARIVGKKG